MEIIRKEVGMLGTNCYIVYSNDTREAIVIDPGDDAELLIDIITTKKLKVKYIVNTHGHADHIGANDEIKKATGAEVLIHTDDAIMLSNASKNLSSFMGENLICEKPARELQDGDTIGIANLEFKVVHTPGHTRGGISLVIDKVVFAGDTLFLESIGRTDLPGGSYSEILKSIKEKLLILSEDTKVYPGHGPETSIGWEKRMNGFIQ